MSDVIAVDLGGTNIRAARINAAGKILAQARTPTRAKDGMAVVAKQIAGLVKKVRGAKTSAVGIGTPGAPDPHTGRMRLPAVNIARSANFPLGPVVQKLTGLATRVDNDANLAALGECWLGAGRGEHIALIFTLGTGIGGGCVIDGKVYNGHHNMGTEFGHCSIDFEGRRCPCGGVGCLEQYASASALGRDARAALQGTSPAAAKSLLWKMCGGPQGLAKVDAKMVCEAARKKDPLALELLDMCALCLASGVGAMINAFNPSCVILGGGLSLAGELLKKRVEKNIGLGRAFGPIWADCKIKMAELGDNAGLLGAAKLALQDVD